MVKWYKEKLNKFSRKSLAMQVLYFEIVLILLVAVAAYIVYLGAEEQISNQRQAYINETADKIMNNINTHLVSIDNLMFTTTHNKDIHRLLLSEDPIQIFDLTKNVDDLSIQIGNLKKEIHHIMAFGENERRYNVGFERFTVEQYQALNEKVSKKTKASLLGKVLIDEKYYAVFGNSIYSIEENLKKLGNLLMVVEESIFTDYLFSELGEFYLINENNQIVFSYSPKKMGHVIHQEEITVSRNEWYIEGMNLRLVGINTNTKTSLSSKIWMLYMLIVGIMLFMVICTYVFFNRYAVKPLYKINSFINSIRGGNLKDLKKRVDIDGAKEIETIGSEINGLLDEVNRLTKQLVTTTTNLYNAELSKQQAELAFLKSQVNPHFLYNTLGTIKGIAMLRGQQEIEDMTSSLVKIFRYSIKGNEQVPLIDELDILKAYILIQKHRFKDRFTIDYDIEDHLLEVKVIKMILQPLIENAIIHGIEPLQGQGSIVVSAKEEEDNVLIEIKDNGCGIHTLILKDLQHKLVESSQENWETNHIGLLNVHKRLQHTYGEQSGLYIKSEESKGTVVSIVLPCEKLDFD